MSVEPDKIRDIFSSLSLEVEQAGDTWMVRPPSFRFDLSEEADLVEEVARVYGYDAIPHRLPRISATPVKPDERRSTEQRMRNSLIQLGYFEAITYSFIAPELAECFAPGLAHEKLANPLSVDMSLMRRSLLPGLAASARHNLNRQHNALAMFEFGMVFEPGESGPARQGNRIAGVRAGLCASQHWDHPARQSDYFDLKHDVESLLAAAGVSGWTTVDLDDDVFQPGQRAAIEFGGREVARFGAAHPRVGVALDIDKSLFLFEIDVESLDMQAARQFQPFSRFPEVRRDLSVVVDEEISVDKCMSAVRAGASGHLRDLELFDVYRGQGIDSGKKSLSLGLIFQALSSTLTDDEVEAAMGAVIASLRDSVGGELRE